MLEALGINMELEPDQVGTQTPPTTYDSDYSTYETRLTL